MGLSIIDTWPDYFLNHHEGLGTTYERFVLHRYFNTIRAKYGVGSVLEVPCFGMTGVSGINSLWWADRGVPVTVMDDDSTRLSSIEKVWGELGLPATFVYTKSFVPLPFVENSFDLSWNFAALWFVQDLEAFLQELVRVTRKAILLCVPNNLGLGFLLRFAFSGKGLQGLKLKNIRPGVLRAAMGCAGWRCSESGYFDVPPWPDIAMKKEDMLKKIGLGMLVHEKSGAPDERLCILDFFNGNKRNMEQDVLKYAFLESSPFFIKTFWAHHRYFVFVPNKK